MADDKKTLFIDGKEVEFTDEPNILEIIRKAGMNVPTFCYRPDLTQFGACRMCVVEIEGRGIQSSCTMPPEPGLKIHFNTENTRRIRKTVLELLLASHDRECTTCERSGTCELQQYSEEYGVRDIRYPSEKLGAEIDEFNPSIVRDPNKCILCGACVRACSEYQGHSVLGFANRGSKTLVQPLAGKGLGEVDCIYCGQCAAVCPTGALSIRTAREQLWDEIVNPNKKVVAQFAPSVRVAIGEMFGLEPGENTSKLIVAALKAMGFDLVFDTNFSADLTITEEATELLSRVTNGGVLPMFTSCCPAWVRYIETTHPDLIPHLSSCRSPQGMMGAIIKEILPQVYADQGFTKDNIVSVSIMPCTAKKSEALRIQFVKDGKHEIDYVITTQELGKMIKTSGIDFKALQPMEPDSPFGQFSGAGTIFGASGGVAEAALRTAYEYATGKTLENVDIKTARGLNREKIVEVDINGTKVVTKIVNTIREAEKAIQQVKKGTADFHFLEVMACPGGCINGGGQPLSFNDSKIKYKRAEGLYHDDTQCVYRKSHENPDIIKLYNDYLEKPNSHKAHEFLHTSYADQFKDSYKDLK